MRKNLQFLILLLSALSLPVLISGCTDSKEVSKMKSTLLNSSFQRGKEGCWATSYAYDLTDDVALRCVETLMLYKNGDFKEGKQFYYNDNLMAETSVSGKWDISHGEGDSYYFEQEYDNSTLNIRNRSFTDEWFNKFDTDMRIAYNGDYDSDNNDGDSGNWGMGIISCSPEAFIIQDLTDDTKYRYNPHVPYLNGITSE